MFNAEYNDPRLIQIYDAEGPWGRDDEYFLAVVNETPGGRVLDVGCGTGRLTIAIAAAGHAVTGIDPSAASLAAARMKPGSEGITWIQGTVEDAPAAAFDVAIMTGHASQFVLGEHAWESALHALWRALVPGGRLAFNAYDPAARVWERWTPQATQRHVTLRDGSSVSIWTEVTSRSDDAVSYAHHYQFSNGDTRRSDSSLRFSSESRLRDSLIATGFTIVRVHGGWHGEPVGAGDGELIFVAQR